MEEEIQGSNESAYNFEQYKALYEQTQRELAIEKAANTKLRAESDKYLDQCQQLQSQINAADLEKKF